MVTRPLIQVNRVFQNAQQVPDALFNEIRQDIEILKRRYDALELPIRQLNSQWSNLSSRHIAESILISIEKDIMNALYFSAQFFCHIVESIPIYIQKDIVKALFIQLLVRQNLHSSLA